MNISMRWKVMAQFFAAFLIIAITGNIVTSLVTSYFEAAYGNGNIIGKTVVSLDPKELDIKKLSLVLQESGVNALKNDSVVALIKESKSWVQILDYNGKEVAEAFKPAGVHDSYSVDEISDLYSNSKEFRDYTIYAFSTASLVKKEDLVNKEKLLNGSKTKDDSAIIVDQKQAYATGEEIPKFIFIIGMPKQKITVYSFVYGIYDYLTQWTNTKSLPKTVSTVFTLLLVLILGYIFTRGITKPVVKITDGISSIAGGDYSVQYSEKGLYKEVYGSLNNTVKALKAAELERKRVEQMREDWIVNLSHDLKTPLSSIKGYGELLNEPEYELTREERERFSKIILDKTAYMEILLEDLKLTQKLKNNLLPMQKTSGNLVELLRETVIDLMNDPVYTGRKVVFESEAEQVMFQYDTVLLQRAFTNILHNAVVHNPEDTSILVGISTGNGIYITVEDNGRGISKEDQKNLFERYYRGTNTEASASGSGLGLAIAKQVIEAHGGIIELESEIGKGTRVRIMFDKNTV